MVLPPVHGAATYTAANQARETDDPEDRAQDHEDGQEERSPAAGRGDLAFGVIRIYGDQNWGNLRVMMSILLRIAFFFSFTQPRYMQQSFWDLSLVCSLL